MHDTFSLGDLYDGHFIWFHLHVTITSPATAIWRRDAIWPLDVIYEGEFDSYQRPIFHMKGCPQFKRSVNFARLYASSTRRREIWFIVRRRYCGDSPRGLLPLSFPSSMDMPVSPMISSFLEWILIYIDYFRQFTLIMPTKLATCNYFH